MALSVDHSHWVPEEIMNIIVKKLPIRSRKSMACVSKAHNKCVGEWCNRVYGGVWFTEEQDELLDRILTQSNDFMHLCAPPRAGKTSIALVAAFGKNGFVRRGDVLFIAAAASIIGVWAREIRRMFSSLNVLKVCSGGVTYEEGIRRTQTSSLANKNIDVVLATPAWILHYLKNGYYMRNFNMETNIPIRWLFIDEAHRCGTTKSLIEGIKKKEYPTLSFTIFITANKNMTSYSEEVESNHVVEMCAIEETALPTPINHFHGVILETAIVENVEATPLKTFIMNEANSVPLHRDKITMLMQLTAWCAKHSILADSSNHRIVCFVPAQVSLPLFVTNAMPLVEGYKLFTIRGGANTIKAIDAFHEYTGKAILFLTYLGAATGFGVRADEAFLLKSMRSTLAHTYQASQRIRCMTNMRRTIHVHYVAYTTPIAIFSYHASILDAQGISFQMNKAHRQKTDTVMQRFASLHIDPYTCSTADFLTVYNNYRPIGDNIGKYLYEHATPKLRERVKAL